MQKTPQRARADRSALRLALAGVLSACVVTLAACGGGVSQETFDKIQVGMTVDQVEEVLGPGEEEKSVGRSVDSSGIVEESGDKGGGKVQSYVWEDGAKKIVVTFSEGKVLTKKKFGF